MSENTQALSGRAVARARRQALTKGKGAEINYASIAQSTSAPVKSSAPERSEPVLAPSSRTRSRDVIVQQPVLTEGRKASLERRKQQVKGKSSRGGAQPTRQPRKAAATVVEATTGVVAQQDEQASSVSNTAKSRSKVNAVKPVSSAQSKGRAVAKAYRKVACEGKAKLQAKMSQNNALTCISATETGGSCREIARQVREQRATQGKVKSTTSRPIGRSSKKSDGNSPEKVGFAMTSNDQEVSGTVLSNTHKMTGSEAGSCRVISGTEYTGPDEYQAKCSFKPDPSVRKVSMTKTTSGRPVSGTEVGLSKYVTGNEAGQCRGVTGTEYLPADQGEMFCGTKSESGPSKVSQSRTAKNQIISGPSMLPREAMTGLEAGSERAITGTQYLSSSAGMDKSPSRAARPGIMSTPTKVDVSETSSGNRVSGTNVNFYKPVTGDEAGFCNSVSGNQYQSSEARAARCGDNLMPAVQKVAESKTFTGQKITGDQAGLGGKITGAGAGRCKSVTGSNYQSLDAVEECGLPIEKVKPDYMNRPGFTTKPATGSQPGPMGLTGAQQGVCSNISGTPYQGADQTSSMCQNSIVAVPGESDFPVLMNTLQSPAMSQQVSSLHVPAYADSEIAVDLTSKITGDGSDQGFSITGDSWGRAGSVTGTEGRWAKGRNVSMKGNSSKSLNLARDFRPETNPQVADSPITGSSGNTKDGASVTVSGGARA